VTAEQLFELAYGRPTNAPGWGMLEAKQTKTLVGPGGERIEIKAGSSHVRYSHWAVRHYPEVFTVCDSRDSGPSGRTPGRSTCPPPARAGDTRRS